MNFSPPFSVQASFNHPAVYYPPNQPLSKSSEQIPTSRFHSISSQWKTQNEQYNHQRHDDNKITVYEPTKKIKISNYYGQCFDNMLDNTSYLAQRNETIKNKIMTSSIPNECFSLNNNLNQILNTNQTLNEDLIQHSEPRHFENETNLGVQFRLRNYPNNESYNFINDRIPMNHNSMREWPARFPQQYSQNQTSASFIYGSHLNLLQNFQNQMVNSQKIYEHFLMTQKNFAGQNPLYCNLKSSNPRKETKKEQNDCNSVLNNKNCLLLEQNTQRKCEDLTTENKTLNKDKNFSEKNKSQIEPNSVDDFPEIHFDSFFQDYSILEFDLNEKIQEEFQVKDLSVIDDKKTPETSISISNAEDGIFKDFYDYQSLEVNSVSQDWQHQIQKEERCLLNKMRLQNKNPTQNNQNKEINPLFLKRKLDTIEETEKISKKQEKRFFCFKKETKKDQIKAIKEVKGEKFGFNKPEESYVDKIQSNLKDMVGRTGQIIKINEDSNIKTLDPSSIQISNTEVTEIQKAKRGRPRLTACSSKESSLVKKEKKINKIQLKTPFGNTLGNLKIPFIVEEGKTRVGKAYQVYVDSFDANNVPKSRGRTIKSLWNPSSIEATKIEEFDVQLTEIFGQEVKNQEAALKILRGTGMDVDSTIDILKRNKLYFKAILFPEPKPVKPQRFH